MLAAFAAAKQAPLGKYAADDGDSSRSCLICGANDSPQPVGFDSLRLLTLRSWLGVLRAALIKKAGK